MDLRVRCVIFLAILCFVKQCEGGSGRGDSDSDVDRSLKDALFLIKLIRTGTAPNMSSVADLLSSFPTISLRAPSLPKAPLNVSSFNNTFQSAWDSPRRKMQKHIRRRNKVKRRPAYYRRQNYGDPFEAHLKTSIVGSTSTTTSAGKSITTASLGVVSTVSAPATTDSETSTVSSASQDKTALNTVQHRSTTSRIIKPSFLRTITQKSGYGVAEPQVKDPVMSQVQSELENELKGVTSSGNKRDILAKLQGHNSHGNRTRNPSTLRIHLKSSSRYPVPLPENHALCYHHPDNALCRTPI